MFLPSIVYNYKRLWLSVKQNLAFFGLFTGLASRIVITLQLLIKRLLPFWLPASSSPLDARRRSISKAGFSGLSLKSAWKDNVFMIGCLWAISKVFPAILQISQIIPLIVRV